MQEPVDQGPSRRETLRAHQAGDWRPRNVATRYDLHQTPHEAVTWPRDVAVARQYFAILYPQLPFEIAKLSSSGPEAVQNFASTWGLLGYERLFFQDQAESFTHPRRPGEEDYRNGVEQMIKTARGGIAAERFGYEPLAWVQAHAYGIAWIIAVYKDLEEANAEAVTHAVMRLPRVSTTSSNRKLECALAWDGPIPYEIAVPIKLTNVAQTIRIIINHNLRGVARMVSNVRTPENRGMPLFSFSALVQYAYWHLANLFDHCINIAQCQSCGYWFAQTDQRQRFCPPPPSQRKSRCGTRARMARLRARPDQVPEATT